MSFQPVNERDVEQSLQAILPPHLFSEARLLARLIAQAAAGSISSEEAQRRIAADPQLRHLVYELGQRKLSTPNALVSFGSGNQTGDVRIRDIAGNDIITLTINVTPPKILENSKLSPEVSWHTTVLILAVCFLALVVSGLALKSLSSSVGNSTPNNLVPSIVLSIAPSLEAVNTASSSSVVASTNTLTPASTPIYVVVTATSDISPTQEVVPTLVANATLAPLITATVIAINTDSDPSVSMNDAIKASFPNKELETLFSSGSDDYNVVVYDNVTNQILFERDMQEPVPGASLIKLFIVGTVYNLAQTGTTNLEESITVTAEDITSGTSGLLVGEVRTIRELCYLMLRDSDNTAGNIILKRIGFDAVAAFDQSLGFSQTRVERFFLETEAIAQGRDNITTVADVLRLFQFLYTDELVSVSASQEMRQALSDKSDIEASRIARLLPQTNITIEDKSGQILSRQNDAAMISFRKSSYIIIVFSNSIEGLNTTADTISQGSRLVFDWFASVE